MQFTAITLSFNQLPELLGRSVESSLAAGCDQVVLVDDGSVPPIRNEWGDRVNLITRRPNSGIPKAFNEAVAHVPRGWVLRNMSDDVMLPHKVSTLMDYITRLDLSKPIYHDYFTATESASMPVNFDGDEHERLGTDNIFYGGATAIPAPLLRLYAHPTYLTLAADWYLHAWLQRRYGWFHIPEMLSLQGQYKTGMSANVDSTELNRQRAWVRRKAKEWGLG